MIVVDLGNTNMTIGFFNNNNLIKKYRYKTADFMHKKNLLNFKEKIKKFTHSNSNKTIILGSVVPKKNYEIKKIAKSIGYKFFILKNSSVKITSKIKNNHFQNFGIDRLANVYGGEIFYGKNLIIIDFGTATTFDIFYNNIYEGGIITPGIELSYQALTNRASKIKKIQLKKINDIVGKNTDDALQSGFYWGYISLVDGIISKIINEKKYNPKIVLTGGLSEIFLNQIKINKKQYKVFIDQNLTLNGLYHIGKDYV